MSQPKNKNLVWLTSLGSGILIVIALTWSLGLVVSGIWRLNKPSEIQTTQPEQSTSDKLPQPQESARDRALQAEKSTHESFAQVQNVPSGRFRYGGSTAWAPLRLLIDSAIQAKRPEFKLIYLETKDSPAGSRIGIQMLLEGELAFIHSSYPLHEKDYVQARQRGFELKEIPVAIDAIAVAVNPSLNIPGLTLEQLSSIYSGKILNWQEVGGPDLEITPYSRPVETGGTVEVFLEYLVLSDRDLGSNVEFFDTTTQALGQLSDTPGGIYYASAPLIFRQCKVKPLSIGRNPGQFVHLYQEPFVPMSLCPEQRNQINISAFKEYPLTRYLYIVVKQNGGIEEQAGEAYANFLLTAQGQEMIAKSGFLPIRR